MRSLIWHVIAFASFPLPAATPEGAAQLKTASHHPMQYYVSLPEGWRADRQWPVLVSIESANRQFRENAETFAAARKHLPFIIVSPLVVTGGGPNARAVPTYSYSNTVWEQIQSSGPLFQFDSDGILAVLDDVHRLYGGESQFYLTGWEAGGHTVWAFTFQHPERLKAVAPVSTNYLGRWMTPEQFSTSPTRANLPIRIFRVTEIPTAFVGQMARARDEAAAHGYKNVSEELVPGKPHGPLADEVLRYFASIAAK